MWVDVTHPPQWTQELSPPGSPAEVPSRKALSPHKVGISPEGSPLRRGSHNALPVVQGRLALACACHSLEQLQSDGPPGLSLHTLAPELQLWVDGAMEHEVLIETF